MKLVLAETSIRYLIFIGVNFPATVRTGPLRKSEYCDWLSPNLFTENCVKINN